MTFPKKKKKKKAPALRMPLQLWPVASAAAPADDALLSSLDQVKIKHLLCGQRLDRTLYSKALQDPHRSALGALFAFQEAQSHSYTTVLNV